eukprot:scaffold131565_cov18-Tisochrysis_lutea.AAC.1
MEHLLPCMQLSCQRLESVKHGDDYFGKAATGVELLAHSNTVMTCRKMMIIAIIYTCRLPSNGLSCHGCRSKDFQRV